MPCFRIYKLLLKHIFLGHGLKNCFFPRNPLKHWNPIWSCIFHFISKRSCTTFSNKNSRPKLMKNDNRSNWTSEICNNLPKQHQPPSSSAAMRAHMARWLERSRNRTRRRMTGGGRQKRIRQERESPSTTQGYSEVCQVSDNLLLTTDDYMKSIN